MRVELHAAAPAKPEYGAACNGCGLCCAVETCPLGMIRFLRRQGPCPALTWQAGRYVCALLSRRAPDGLAARMVARWIAAGKGCDCHYQQS